MEKLEKRLRARDFAPVRAALLLLGLLIAFSVQLLRASEGAMLWIYSHISRPYHASCPASARISASPRPSFFTPC